VVGYARYHCSSYPGRFLPIEQLLSPSTGGIRKAYPVELGDPAVAAEASKTDQSEFGKPTSAYQ